MTTDLYWFKSSYSGENSGNCIEVALAWSKSSYSGNQGGDCVEVAACPHTVHVRDSKDLAVPSLALSPDAWASFVGFAAVATE
ncbi:DUF397 domain-containing protein [Streptomyces finlayi]|uniref:DUF397 domain-containing protein n=1 Tax=Streptomyces finlayi TaxID=67296 RepID=A0A7G7BK97_9ACTN|nr:DUF397 domain-containing protein [Streptomyces finlayi]QNE75762.1 DUF397 domain-containing protein [Streptomyces finlayi]